MQLFKMRSIAKLEEMGRDFWIFNIGQLISFIGDKCIEIGFVWWILDKTGSAAKAAMILTPAMVVRIFLLPLLGPLGDFFKRKNIIIFADLWRFVLELLLTIMVFTDNFNMLAVFSIFILASIGSAAHASVSSSIIPQLVPPEKFEQAITISRAINSFGALAGAILGGAIVSLIGLGGAFLFNTISFFIAGVASFFIRANTIPMRSDGREKYGIKKWFSDLQAGIVSIVQIKVHLKLALFIAVTSMLFSFMNIGFPAFAKSFRDGEGISYLAFMNMSLSIGFFIGFLFVGQLTRKISKYKLIILGFLATALMFVLLPMNSLYYYPLVLLLLAGLMGPLANVPMTTQMALGIPEEYRSRFDSISNFLLMASVPAGTALSGYLLTIISASQLLQVAGILIIIVTILSLLQGEFRQFFKMNQAELVEFYQKALLK